MLTDKEEKELELLENKNIVWDFSHGTDFMTESKKTFRIYNLRKKAQYPIGAELEKKYNYYYNRNLFFLYFAIGIIIFALLFNILLF